ncbi:succinate--hydroxymethylglutarate CoA-transferase [Condylostylus longicornis]|uniref:succinate--hydroxymethylglutarate CoA-transferase n=1 Tax=Condylostylus longicornis TaxID=2530218 RepID=UPI00244DB4A6|nr:succinate--hydroxymethylglutarate CoA-transferase [Condylostylus longicornis]
MHFLKLAKLYKTQSRFFVTSTKVHPLKGIRILDLTRIIAGPYCSMVLSDLGAEVIKVERPNIGDEARKWGPPFLKNSKDSVYFQSVNRNKKSICIDFKKGQKILHELVRKSDILIENFVPGVLEKYNMDYSTLKTLAPHLIYCSITGYGSIGPYSQRPGYDVIAASMGGLLHITGHPDGPPAKVGVAVTDIATGLYAHGAILAALLQREKNGQGQKIDVNLLSTQVASLINVASNYLNANKEAQRWGTAHESIVPYESFETSNGYLTLGTGSDDQFQHLCRILKLNDLLTDGKFTTNKDRVKNRKELITILSKVFKTQTSSFWMKVFENASFPVGPVNNMKEVFSDPHIKSINLVKELDHLMDGKVKVVGPPVVYEIAENNARTAPPILGQHTSEILKNVLGYDDIEIKNLKNKQIVQ